MTLSFFSNCLLFGILEPIKIENLFSFIKKTFPLNFSYIFGNISFIVLFVAVLLYWFDFSDTQRGSKKLKIFCMLGSNFALTCLLLVRWWESGHFPLSNLYESLIGLSWGFTTVHLFLTFDFSMSTYKIQKSTGPLSDKVGAIIAPTALLTSVFANFFLPPEMLKTTALIPALKSNWLTMHVSVMIISYAFLIVGSLLSIAFCAYRFTSVKFGLPKKSHKANFINFLDLKIRQKGLFSFQNQHLKEFSGELVLPTTPTVNKAQTAGTLTQNMGLIFQKDEKQYKRGRNEKLDNFRDTYNSSHKEDSVLHRGSHLQVREKNDFIQLEQNFVSTNPSQTKVQYDICVWLNTMSYRVLGLGFPLLTIGILSGAVWANEAWGSYWSWDPKETWALITWLVFAVYFHSRYNRSSDISPIPASIASFGFVVIWICYLGVNILGSGLHSYGWFAFLNFNF